MVKKTRGVKTRCNETWTEARFTSFIKGALRGASRKWAPIHTCKKLARISRNLYQCADCGPVPGTIKVPGKKKPVNNVTVDHVDPVIDPTEGFKDFNTFIENLFCEVKNLQLLCLPCHKIKCDKEKAEAAEARNQRKLRG